jgi:putative ABC transport system permease protein
MAPVISSQTTTLDPLKPFQEKMFMIQEDGTVTSPKDHAVSSYGSNSKYYITERLQYEAGDDQISKYKLIPDTSDPSASRYRKLIPKGKTVVYEGDLLFDPEIIGSFKGSEIVQSKFDPSPLGIYGFSPAVLIRDRDGNPVNRELSKNFTPDTFLPIQPAGLTNLELAQWLKGDAPIDAIRVRVAGIEGYNKKSEHKILQVAQAIQESTGLHTVIVAGASKQNVTVEVPAVGSYPAVGIVQEVWTGLGVATKIEHAVNKMSLLTLAGLFLIVIVYTIVHTQTLFIVRQNEFHVLQAIGWRKQDIRKLLLREWGLKLLIAFVISLGALWLLRPVLDIAKHWPLLLGIQAVMFLFLLTAVHLTVNKIQEETIKPGANAEWSGKSAASPTSIGSASRSNFVRQLKYNLLNITLIAVSGTVALFTANMILGVQQNINTTFLGNAVKEATASSQWLIVAASTAVTLFGIWEATRAMAAKREREIYFLRIIGWNQFHVVRLIAGELALVLGIGFGAAMLAGLGIYRIFYEEFPIPMGVQLTSCISLAILLTTLSAFLVKRVTKKVI